MNILITGASGTIGPYLCTTLSRRGHTVVKLKSRLEDKIGIEEEFHTQIDLVIHLASLKNIAESIKDPLRYYRTNITGTLILLEVMKKYGIRRLIFASSIAVYDESPSTNFVVSEQSPLSPTNPYSFSKKVCEEILQDLASADPTWQITILRYASIFGGTPELSAFLNIISEVSSGKRKELTIYGGNNTPDGTAIRDYIHIDDLVRAHLLVIETGITGIYNIGSGTGHSIKELVGTLPHQICPRPVGDVAPVIADISLIKSKLGWEPIHFLQ